MNLLHKLGLLNESNILTILKVLLKQLKINVTSNSLKNDIDENPFSPSLFTIVDILKKYGVSSLAIDNSNHSYNNYNVPYIVSIKKEEWAHSNFSIVKDIDLNIINYYDPINNKWVYTDIENFKKWDNGILLLLEKNDINGETSFAEKKKKQVISKLIKLTPFIILSIFFFYKSLHIIDVDNYIFNIGMFALCTIGLYISYSITISKFENDNYFLKNVCSINKQFNCKNVITSKSSSVYGIDWSILGFAYFFGGILSILIFGINNKSLSLFLSVLSFLCFPYIFYSIYTQYKIIKKWCTLCLIIQIILGFQTFLSIMYLNSFFLSIENMNLNDYSSFINIYILILIFSVLFWKKEKMMVESLRLKKELNFMKFNKMVFDGLLVIQPNIRKKYPNDLGIITGNKMAKTEILEISDLFCKSCKESHYLLKEIILKNQDIKLRTIFITKQSEFNLKADITLYLIKLSRKYSNDKIALILDYWYNSDENDLINKFQKFKEKFPLKNNLTTSDDILYKMNDWCKENAITETPTIFINGKKIMSNYSIKDLKYILIDKI